MVQSCSSSLAAELSAALPHSLARTSARATSSLKTRVGGSRAGASGRLSRRGRRHAGIATGSRGCAYKTASGRHEWPNQDPLGDEVLLRQASKGLNPIIVAMLRREALANPYGFVHNTPLNAVDPDGQTTIVIGGGVIVVGGVIVSVWVCYAIPECRQALEKLGKGILDLLRDACKGPERPKSEKCELTNDFDDYNIDPPIKRCIYKCPSQKLPVQRAFPAGTPCEKTITQPIP